MTEGFSNCVLSFRRIGSLNYIWSKLADPEIFVEGGGGGKIEDDTINLNPTETKQTIIQNFGPEADT